MKIITVLFISLMALNIHASDYIIYHSETGIISERLTEKPNVTQGKIQAGTRTYCTTKLMAAEVTCLTESSKTLSDVTVIEVLEYKPELSNETKALIEVINEVLASSGKSVKTTDVQAKLKGKSK